MIDFGKMSEVGGDYGKRKRGTSGPLQISTTRNRKGAIHMMFNFVEAKGV